MEFRYCYYNMDSDIVTTIWNLDIVTTIWNSDVVSEIGRRLLGSS